MNIAYKMAFIALCLYSSLSMADEWFYPVADAENKDNLRITQEFMDRDSPKNLYSNKVHLGVDIGEPRNGDYAYDRTVRAISRGRVIYIGTGYNSGWGNTVVLRHDALRSPRYIFSSYSHLDSISVEEGDLLQGGEQIGIMGSTGNSTATHLHFQVFTKDNGYTSWDTFGVSDMGAGYISDSTLSSNYSDGYLYKMGSTHHYNGILFIDFMRLTAISPPSIQTYSVNGDDQLGNPAGLMVNSGNVIEVTVATYRKDISMYFSLRNYSGGTSIRGDMTLVNSTPGTWIMSDSYSPLGDDLSDGGWNKEWLLKYRYTFTPQVEDSNADLAVFWKPKNYNSSMLILPIPGGLAYNTITSTGRYVSRPVVK